MPSRSLVKRWPTFFLAFRLLRCAFLRESGEVTADTEREKHLAALAAASLVEDDMMIGLGTGTTVAHLLPLLAARRLRITCVATSPATEAAADNLGFRVIPFESIDRLDMAIDGADQVDPQCWLVKGGGGAHTREKVVAAATDRFIVIVSSDKLVARLHPPVPLELLSFGLQSTLVALGDASLRQVPMTPDGGVLADLHDDVDDPAALSVRLGAIPGLIAHGLFPPHMVSLVLIGQGDGVVARQPNA
jgi:ribose 5-phosphate isomerase A